MESVSMPGVNLAQILNSNLMSSVALKGVMHQRAGSEEV